MKKITVLNPYNNEHVKLLTNYEQENLVDTKAIELINTCREQMTEEEYEKAQYINNDFQYILMIEEDNQIKDYCHISGEKDRKTCYLLLGAKQKQTKKRDIIEYASNYAFDILGMNDIFLTENNENNHLITSGFYCLGETNGNIIYLKQREDIEENKKVI